MFERERERELKTQKVDFTTMNQIICQKNRRTNITIESKTITGGGWESQQFRTWTFSTGINMETVGETASSWNG